MSTSEVDTHTGTETSADTNADADTNTHMDTDSEPDDTGDTSARGCEVDSEFYAFGRLRHDPVMTNTDPMRHSPARA